MPRQPSTSNDDSGFTRIELVAVLVIITCGFLLLQTALARTRVDSRGMRCLNNNRELNRAWRMWTDDNNDLLLFASHDGTASPDNKRAWVISELDFSSNQANWDPALSVMKSPLWPYCGTNTGIWRCPADDSYVLVSGVVKPRVRSYSMNVFLGGFAGAAPEGASAYRLYLKSSDMVAPSPDRLFVFLDQRSDSINWGNFVTRMDGYSPKNPALYVFGGDVPGYYHDGSATFSYADGHGEIHRWQDRRTTPPGPAVFSVTIITPRNPDVAWLQDHATRPK